MRMDARKTHLTHQPVLHTLPFHPSLTLLQPQTGIFIVKGACEKSARGVYPPPRSLTYVQTHHHLPKNLKSVFEVDDGAAVRSPPLQRAGKPARLPASVSYACIKPDGNALYWIVGGRDMGTLSRKGRAKYVKYCLSECLPPHQLISL